MSISEPGNNRQKEEKMGLDPSSESLSRAITVISETSSLLEKSAAEDTWLILNDAIHSVDLFRNDKHISLNQKKTLEALFKKLIERRKDFSRRSVK
jgi:hypothetical protein